METKTIIEKNMSKHNKYLSPFACRDEQAIRLNDELTDDIRPPFFRDIDRIIYSLSYTRYIDKTQVFSLNDNDNISKRIIHVQLVSKIARTIGRALNLNEDLIEAASLGHDLGHVPFGHLGEKILNEISMSNNEGHFFHNVQSVRTLMIIENKDITIQVLDAILCHNGETLLQEYKPVIKTKQEFLNQYENCYQDKDEAQKILPMTLEGCVVRISDIIGYIGRDLEDAIRLQIITKNDIPSKVKKILGDNNKDIINNIIRDIIFCSYDKNAIIMSDPIYEALQLLISFNYKNIYDKANNQEQIDKRREQFSKLFGYYRQAIETSLTNSDIFTAFLNHMSDEYNNNNSTCRKIIDYIAGMTDDYFIKKYQDNCEN